MRKTLDPTVATRSFMIITMPAVMWGSAAHAVDCVDSTPQDCAAGGATDICRWAGGSPILLECDLTRNGDATSAAAYAVLDSAGGY